MNLTANPEHGKSTVEDYLKTPDGPPWYELIEGQLVQEPSATINHQSIVRELTFALVKYLKGRPLGMLFFAPLDFHLDSRNVFQPDIAVILGSQPALFAGRWIQGAPDFAIEVLSPSNQHRDRGVKRRVYARSGVKELWIVDPKTQAIESFLLQSDPERPAQTWSMGNFASSPLFPAFSIAIAEIFSGLLGGPGAS
jgi:Uma2 family endonuclease